MKTVGLLFLSLVAGCASTEDSLRQNASFKLDCAKEKLKIVELGMQKYGVSGCNNRATYYCGLGGIGGCIEESTAIKMQQ